MRLETVADLDPSRIVEVRAVLDAAFGRDFSDDDWTHALGGRHVVGFDASGTIIAHAAVVPRELHIAGRPWRAGFVEAVATTLDRRREGLGSLLLTEVGRIIRSEYEVGALSTEVHGFYETLGWERWQGPTFVRCADGVEERSADDDDGVMVLRFGSSARADLRAPISCEERVGDDW